MKSPMEAKPAQVTFQAIHRTACSIGDVAENWVFRANSERRYHFRADHESLDQMLIFLVENSLIFGEDR